MGQLALGHLAELCRTAIISHMSDVPATFASESMRAEKRKAAGNSLLAALAITGLKIFVGVTTGSLGILSEAAHSALDLVAATITLIFGAGL